MTLLVHTHDISNILIFSFSELIQLSVATTLAHAVIILPLDDCLSLLTEFPLVPPICSPPSSERDPIKTQASVAYSSAQNPPMAPVSCQLKYTVNTKTFMASQSGPTTSPPSSISCSLHPLCFSYTGLLEFLNNTKCGCTSGSLLLLFCLEHTSPRLSHDVFPQFSRSLFTCPLIREVFPGHSILSHTITPSPIPATSPLALLYFSYIFFITLGHKMLVESHNDSLS